MNKENIKRYLLSSLITFVTAFAMVVLSQIDSITLESFKDGSLIGLLFVAIRAGFKAVLELVILIFKDK